MVAPQRILTLLPILLALGVFTFRLLTEVRYPLPEAGQVWTVAPAASPPTTLRHAQPLTQTRPAYLTGDLPGLTCNGPTERFEAGLPPGWITYAPVANTPLWIVATGLKCDEVTASKNFASTGLAACASSFTAVSQVDTYLCTNALDLSQASAATMTFRLNFQVLGEEGDENNRFEVLPATVGGTGSLLNMPLLSLNTDQGINMESNSGLTQTVSLTDYALQPELYICFRYKGQNSWYAHLDDVSLNCTLPQIELRQTVGTDPTTCAGSDKVIVTPNTAVTYCYQAHNRGQVPLDSHTITDDQLGHLQTDWSQPLLPGETIWFTHTARITVTTRNQATWAARNTATGQMANATAQARVVVTEPALVLTKTVGLAADQCAATQAITITKGAFVNYCFTVENTSAITLTRHTLIDDQLGTLLNNYIFNLAPGARTKIQQPTHIDHSTISTATWTADSVLGSAQATATTRVTINSYRVLLPLIVSDVYSETLVVNTHPPSS